MEIKKKLFEFVKKETVLTVAILLAILSAVMVPPDGEYAGYIDFRTLSILFCLMTVMAGLQKLGVFRRIGEILLQHTHTTMQLVQVLVLMCFFFSMIITNDVALITFVPFTFTVLRLSGEDSVKKLAVPVIILQTIAANLGSMLTPIGNPQNLYLYGKAQMSAGAFVLLMLPYSLLSLLLLPQAARERARAEAQTTERMGFIFMKKDSFRFVLRIGYRANLKGTLKTEQTAKNLPGGGEPSGREVIGCTLVLDPAGHLG